LLVPHPLMLPSPLTEEQIRAAYVGVLVPRVGPIQIVEYDPEWPRLFEREAKRIRATPGDLNADLIPKA
jgi:GrpB-like predicted nucleotidyltransferase (UPF0157 family)